MNSTIDLLRGEIQAELETLKSMELGSKEYSSAVENIAKLTAQMKDLEKLQIDSEEQAKKRDEARAQSEAELNLKKEQGEAELNLKKEQSEAELNLKKEQSEAELNLKKEQLRQTKAQAEAELNLKKQQMKEEKKGRTIRTFVEIGGILVPVLVTVWGTIVTLNFEREGTVTTHAGRNFMNWLFRRK